MCVCVCEREGEGEGEREREHATQPLNRRNGERERVCGCVFVCLYRMCAVSYFTGLLRYQRQVET